MTPQIKSVLLFIEAFFGEGFQQVTFYLNGHKHDEVIKKSCSVNHDSTQEGEYVGKEGPANKDMLDI